MRTTMTQCDTSYLCAALPSLIHYVDQMIHYVDHDFPYWLSALRSNDPYDPTIMPLYYPQYILGRNRERRGSVDHVDHFPDSGVIPRG